MRKATWITFCGWLSFGLVLFVVGAGLLGSGRPVPVISARVAGVCLVFSVPAFGLWILGTLVHRFRVHGARLHAAAMVQAQKRAESAMCEMCGEWPATVRCTRHLVSICARCWTPHNREDCTYAQLVGGAPAKRAVVR